MRKKLAIAITIASIACAGTALAQQTSGGPSSGDNTVSAGQCRSANPPILCDNAINMNIPDVKMDGSLVAGAAVPGTLDTTMVQGSDRYAVASINGKRLLIDTQNDTVVDVLN